MDELEDAERFFLAVQSRRIPLKHFQLIPITHFKERLQCFVFKREFKRKVTEMTSNLSTIETGIQEVKESQKLKTILKLVLDIGNHMNAAYFGGQAKGVKLGSILLVCLFLFFIQCIQLQDMKSNDGTFTLLEYLINLLTDSGHGDILNIAEDVPSCKQSSKGHPLLKIANSSRTY